MTSLWKRLSDPPGRIFISYRREDKPWFVGRLVDSLSHYFGDGRVFRDVGYIEGGADFHHVLGETLDSADALIAVIGPNWLKETDGNTDRTVDDPDDWVAQEIGVALDRDIPVYPVLVEDTPMPKDSDLPPALKRLTRYNAVSLGDDRWDIDLKRLARIVGLDIPSATERKLKFWNLIATLALVASVWITMAMVAYKYMGDRDWFVVSKAGICGDAAYPIIDKWQVSILWLILVPCVALLFSLANKVAKSSKGFFLAAAWVGSLGTFATVVLLLPVCPNFEAAIFLFVGIPIVATVLGLMNLSGFVPK